MSKLLVEERQIVVPGQELAEGMDYLPGEDVFRDGDKLFAMKLGLFNLSGRLVKVTALCGSYLPNGGDLVIGKVVSVGLNGWRVDIGWAFEANLNLKDASSDYIDRGADLTKYFDTGEYILTQITNVSGSKIVDLTMKGPGLRKLGPGRIFKVGSSKVPRIIGKQGSMISMIKETTNCKISVGQNGFIWLIGDNLPDEILAVNAIRKVEEESHIQGLTEKIKEYLESNKNGK